MDAVAEHRDDLAGARLHLGQHGRRARSCTWPALQTIPGELYEAAELDGASVWQRLRHVTIPQMRFILLVLLLLQIIATMQVFIEPFQLTGDHRPDTITVMVLIYRYAFTVNNDFGLAAAMSVLLFVVLGAFSALYLRLTRED